MQAEVGALFPEAVATTSWGTPSLDIGAGLRAQLMALDVTVPRWPPAPGSPSTSTPTAATVPGPAGSPG